MRASSQIRARSLSGSRIAGTAIAAVVCLLPAPALAHGSLAVGDFYNGLLQPVLHFESLLPTLAIGLWATQLDGESVWRLPLCFSVAVLVGGAAAGLGLQLDGTAWTRHLAMLLIGLLVAARWRLPSAGVLVIGICVGLALGYLALFEERTTIQRPALYLVGLCCGVGLLCFHLESLVLRVRTFWMEIAVRVLGSWIAAIGLLVGVLAATGAMPRP